MLTYSCIFLITNVWCLSRMPHHMVRIMLLPRKKLITLLTVMRCLSRQFSGILESQATNLAGEGLPFIVISSMDDKLIFSLEYFASEFTGVVRHGTGYTVGVV